MLRILISLLLTLTFTSIYSQKMDIAEPVRILALGDSYTIGESVDSLQRFPEHLRRALSEQFSVSDVKVVAKTGWRTDQLIEAINRVNPQGFNLVTLLIGVNNQYQGRPIQDMKKDFQCLLREAISRAGENKRRVLIISIPDYAYTPFGQTKVAEKISKEIDEYNQWQKETALKNDIFYVNITEISREGLVKPELVASDGLHPSGIQYSLWVDKIMAELFK
jgi:acyl-CoA thioesterase-1